MIKTKNEKLGNEVKKMRSQFRKALMANNNEEMTRIYGEIERLENKINLDNKEGREKEERFNEYKNEEERRQAIKDVDDFCNNRRQDYIKERNEVLNNIKEAKQNYINALKPLNKLNMNYYNAAFNYFVLINKHNLKDNEVAIGYSNILSDIAPHPRVLTVSEYDINKQIRQMD